LDVESLRSALRESMLDGDERQRRGSAGRKLAERFSPPVTSRQLLDLYRDIVDRGERLPAAS
jgi:glycosyltransferase involved in cell wall biosynthesis